MMRLAFVLLSLVVSRDGRRQLLCMGPLPWGKKPCKDWRNGLLSHDRHAAVSLGDDQFMVHPLALRWTDDVVAPGHAPASPPAHADLPTVRPSFDDMNSAAHVLAAADVDWARVRRLAHTLDERGSRGVDSVGADAAGVAAAEDGAPRERLVVDVFRCAASGEWQVADTLSLEVVIAHALRDRAARVRLRTHGGGGGGGGPDREEGGFDDGDCAVGGGGGVALDPTKAFAPRRRARVAAAPVAAAALRWSDGLRVVATPTAADDGGGARGGGARDGGGESARPPARLMMDPALAMNSRDREAPVWPKVTVQTSRAEHHGDTLLLLLTS